MMKRSPEEKAALRQSFRAMTPGAKVSYLLGYYWWAFALGILAAALLISGIVKLCTKKETVLSVALVNVSVGEDLEQQLTDDFLNTISLSTEKNQVLLLSGYYMTDDASAEDHEYAYASRMKIMAAIASKQLDIVLMNRESYDLCSEDGYLLDLSEALSENNSELYQALSPFLMENDVVLEDNATDVDFNMTTARKTITRSSVNGIDVTGLPMFQSAGFPDAVYIGIVANTTRLPVCLQYLNYLCI